VDHQKLGDEGLPAGGGDRDHKGVLEVQKALLDGGLLGRIQVEDSPFFQKLYRFFWKPII
jgi:hypothetical protein